MKYIKGIVLTIISLFLLAYIGTVILTNMSPISPGLTINSSGETASLSDCVAPQTDFQRKYCAKHNCTMLFLKERNLKTSQINIPSVAYNFSDDPDLIKVTITNSVNKKTYVCAIRGDRVDEIIEQ